MARKDDVAAVVPVYNPEPGLKALCVSLVRAYGTVVVVDDGSTEHVEDFDTLPDGVQLVRHEVNRGKGRAIKTSIEWLKVNRPNVRVAVFVDGDGQHRPADVAKVVAKAQVTDHVVLGVRDFSQAKIPFRSRFGNSLTSFLVRLIYRIPIFDTQTGLRAIPSRLFDLMLATSGERYEYEMRLFGMLDEADETLEQIRIGTIYLENNRASHFHPVRDSIRVYQGLFGSGPLKFLFSSLTGFAVDIGAFTAILSFFEKFSLLNVATAILIAHGVARILSAGVNYELNRRLVFESKARPVDSVWKYATLAVLIWTLSYVCTTVFTMTFNATGVHITVIKLVTDIVLFILSYHIQKGWVFGHREVMAIPFVRRGWSLIEPVFLFFGLLIVDTIVGMYVDHNPVTWRSWAYIFSESLKSLFMVMAIPLVFRRDSRFLMPFLFVLLAFYEAINLVSYLGGMGPLTGQIFALILGSSRAETASFCSSFINGFSVTVALSFLIVLVWGCWRLWKRPGIYPKNRFGSCALGLLLLVFSVVSRPPTHLLFASFLVDSVRQYDRYQILGTTASSPDLSDVEKPVKEERVPLVMLILGESSTRSHWQLYGYARETTPRLAARAQKGELIVFDDVLTAWGHTQESLFLLLTRASLEAPNDVVAMLPQVLSAAGYRCALFSAQEHWGKFDTIDALLFSGCEERVYVEDLKPKVEGFDERLLPYVHDALTNPTNTRPNALFVHLYGDHYPFVYRYPESFIHFSAGQTVEERKRSVESYDDSIRHTDAVLDALISEVEATGREAIVLYLSDHGETIHSPQNRTLTDPDLWTIPFVVWCSPAYRAAHPEWVEALLRVKDKPLQTDRIYDGLLNLANVSLKDREDQSFLSEAFDWSLPRKIENGEREVEPRFGSLGTCPPPAEPEGEGGSR